MPDTIIAPPPPGAQLELPPVNLDPSRVGTNRINVGANTVVQNTEHLPAHQRLLVRWLHTWALDHNYPWAQLEKEIQIDTSTIWRVWHDKYRYSAGHPKAGERVPLAGICAKIAGFRQRMERIEGRVNPNFVETSVWNAVNRLCRHVLARHSVGHIYGESQIGKKTCLREFARRNDHGQTHVAEMPPASGVQNMLRKIAQSLHVASHTCFDKLRDDVCDALDESKLLIVIQVHRAFTTYQKGSAVRCLDTLMHLHDASGCGMLLCGTNIWRDQLRSGPYAQFLKQLRRRGIYELQLPDVPPRRDLDLIAARFGLDAAEGEAEEIMLAVAQSDGFGKFCALLADAAEGASSRDEALAWSHFIRAHAVMQAAAQGKLKEWMREAERTP